MMRLFSPMDLAEINGWYQRRGLLPVTLDVLPNNGFIEPGVAAGFLYLTDASLGLLEGFVTNPDASVEERSRAIGTMTGLLMEAARRKGVRHLVAIYEEPGIGARAKRLGMTIAGPYMLATKELR